MRNERDHRVESSDSSFEGSDNDRKTLQTAVHTSKKNKRQLCFNKKHDKRHGERQQGTIGLLKYTADLINSNQMFNMLAQSQAQSQAQLLANQSALRHQMLQTHGSHQAAMSHF